MENRACRFHEITARLLQISKKHDSVIPSLLSTEMLNTNSLGSTEK